MHSLVARNQSAVRTALSNLPQRDRVDEIDAIAPHRPTASLTICHAIHHRRNKRITAQTRPSHWVSTLHHLQWVGLRVEHMGFQIQQVVVREE